MTTPKRTGRPRNSEKPKRVRTIPYKPIIYPWRLSIMPTQVNGHDELIANINSYYVAFTHWQMTGHLQAAVDAAYYLRKVRLQGKLIFQELSAWTKEVNTARRSSKSADTFHDRMSEDEHIAYERNRILQMQTYEFCMNNNKKDEQ